MSNIILYGIATEMEQSCGQGSDFKTKRICRSGAYEDALFPPIFQSKEAAEAYVIVGSSSIIKLSVVALRFVPEVMKKRD